MTQEFHISVTPVGQNDYLVRTEQVAPGVPLAEELVTWPVADWLAAAGHLMNDPLKSVLQGDAIALNVNLVALGQQFYNELFKGTLRDSWITAQGIAQNQQQVLRLRLGLKDIRLARLPWEVMHAGDRPLATGPYIAFSRFQTGIHLPSRLLSTNIPTPLEEGGIKVLMAIASPTDLVRLDLLKLEAVKLQAELHRQSPRFSETGNYLPEIELTLLEQPGREELTQALEQGRYHVLHYSGHSNLGPNGGEIYLVNNRTGLTETLSGDDLAGLLVNNNIQMAVFNSCLGAYTATSDPAADTGERNLAESLVKRGMRSVLAMSERIPDEVALTLTQLFYRNLSQGYPVDLCVSRVRQGLISAYGSLQMYWALPILYLDPKFNGNLTPEITLGENVESFGEYNPRLMGTSIYSGSANDLEMPLPMEDMIPSGLDWLGEDTWGDLVDEIEYDDSSYEEDSAIVSDLFRQIDNQNAANEQPYVTAELIPKPQEDNILGRPIPGDMSLDSETPMWGDWDNANNPPSSDRPEVQPATRRATRRLWTIVGVVGVGAIAMAIGLSSLWQRQFPNFSELPQIPNQSQPVPNNTPEIDLKTSSTGIVTATATQKLVQGDLQGGLQAVEELLSPSRNALAAAQAALDLIPSSQANDPAVNFLKGRVAWQAIQSGDKKYSVDDARRYWESAVKAKPDSLLYTNALGFAYYAEGNMNRANDSWFKALNLALKQQNPSGYTPTAATPQVATPEALTSYAGLALGLYKSAHEQSENKRSQYMTEAVKLRQLVVKDDPVNFLPNKLGNNWLWTEKAIQDWRSLLQVKGGQ
ncbi:heterocyst differentiation protein HetF [Tolypothrix sp. NIES-4075]|uniref:cell division protein HetF n=1 Tax=Tolypothrix sp. NIES-4075 TaxID=2005459 RepID=UPI000B5CE880|nr:cell division protein HetF [Tolypothrix sp. NIES-4075]GAX40619.1 heterocyst differentiation protein HetF [Tolypothrix sp. NIES-4075]